MDSCGADASAALKRAGASCAQVHTVEELRRVLELPEELLDPSAVLLGINNRDLQTFKVSLDNTAAIMGSEAGQQVGLTALLSRVRGV